MRTFDSIASSARTALTRARSSAGACGQSPVSRRTFTSFPTLRPTLQPRTNTVFRPSTLSNPSPIPTTPSSTAVESSTTVVDIVPKTAITSHPVLHGVQIRCGPRPTMARTSRLVRKRRHGFLSRIRTRTGRATLQRRKSKGRRMLSN